MSFTPDFLRSETRNRSGRPGRSAGPRHRGPFLEQSYELGSQAGDKRAMSEALRHLGIAEHRAGRLGAARQRLGVSVRLRREIGLLPGVAANLVGLAYIAAGDGHHDAVLALLTEAARSPRPAALIASPAR